MQARQNVQKSDCYADYGAHEAGVVKTSQGAPRGTQAPRNRCVPNAKPPPPEESPALKSSYDQIATEALTFVDDGAIPNHPTFALLLHRKAFDPRGEEPAVAAEALFAANGWGGFWRNGVYPFHHYHSTCHEALAVAAGWGEVLFGGEGGRTVRLEAGDVAVLPAGTGHKRIAASDDFLVVGAYPPNQPYDLIRDPAEHDAALARIKAVPAPATDPVFGAEGGLRTLWANGV